MKDLLSGVIGGVVGGIATILAAIVGMVVALRQVREMSRTLQAQTYMSILERADRIGLSPAMDYIKSLAEHQTYPVFKQQHPNEALAIRKIADFFNDLAHLMRNGYIDDTKVPRLYYPSLRACGEKLGSWWIEGLRKERGQPYLYENFEHLCRYVLELKGYEEEIEREPFSKWFERVHLSGCPVCARIESHVSINSRPAALV
jgi:hypothetical protein